MPVEIPDPPDAKTLARVGLTQAEYEELCRRLNRKPNIVEMGMVGAMWSEHCAYKSSKVHLRKFPTTGPRVLQGPGENAGAVLLRDDLAAVFKIESHNHPSAVEPFQAAATGVGGIIRDIFSMGARPIATLDPLRFGPITDFYDPGISRAAVERNRFLFEGVVAGIAHYGNCVGLPTVGGEVVFDLSYSLNPLMNGLCLGIVKPGELIRAYAQGEGNRVLLVGAKTGADGVQGATFASVDLAEDVEQDRPAVQIGDPFLEKCLIEATLALKKHPALIGVQDLGAAGLTSSSCEMAGRGQVGLKLNLDKVPLRQRHIGPYEIMLSESQERMLMVVQKDGVAAVNEEFTRWGLDSADVGEVISEPVVSLWWRGEEVVRLPTALLTAEAPEHDRPRAELKRPEWLRLDADSAVRRAAERSLPGDFPVTLNLSTAEERVLALMLAHPNHASKRMVWRRYDHQVIDNTVAAPEGADAAVLRIKGGHDGIAVSTDGPGHLCALEPFLGGQHSVKEAYLNLLTVGAEPLAYTNCLNFASPEDPEVMAGFAAVVEGMALASRELETPVVSGNVSFYNQTVGGKVVPTPVIGMVGYVPEVRRILRSAWPAGASLYAVSYGGWRLDGSCLAWDLLHEREGAVERLDFGWLRTLKDFVQRAVADGMLTAAHDLDSGGLALALAECCYGRVGAEVQLSARLVEAAGGVGRLLFGWPPVGMLLAVSPAKEREFAALADTHCIPLEPLGMTGGSDLVVSAAGSRTPLISLPVNALTAIHREALPFWMRF